MSDKAITHLTEAIDFLSAFKAQTEDLDVETMAMGKYGCLLPVEVLAKGTRMTVADFEDFRSERKAQGKAEGETVGETIELLRNAVDQLETSETVGIDTLRTLH